LLGSFEGSRKARKAIVHKGLQAIYPLNSPTRFPDEPFFSAPVAVIAAMATAKRREVEKSSPLRLIGYLLIWLLPQLMSEALGMSARLYMHPFRIPSGNMEPTLHVGDFVVVSKTSYGLGPYSTAPWVGLIQRDPADIRAPALGDIAVFRPPSEPDRDFVKRVVGLPGDRIQMIEGVLHINGAPVKLEPLAPVEIVTPYDGVQYVPAYRETLPNGVSYVVLDMGVTELDNTRVFVVPDGHYFLMGDHRDNSDDSRRSVRFVPIENFVGRVDHIVRGGGPVD
jgi:signal peptidase I